jgi:hypothetical protein
LSPLLETWRQGVRIVRCHHSDFGATEFNPGLGFGRFHPFLNASGTIVPILYGSDSLKGALAETVFHNIPIRGPKRRLLRSSLKTKLVSVIAPRRDLRLVQIHGYGLRRLELLRSDLIDSDASQYGRTAAWAQALHASSADVQGLVWVSRQHDTSLALVLFGDRVAREDLKVMEAPLPLANGVGFRKLRRAADEAGITIVRR